jgi:hypothetical protein
MKPSQIEILNTSANKQRLLLVGCFLLAIIMLWVDYLSGPLIRFPILYLLPIVLAAWLNSLRWGSAFAVAMPVIHLSFTKFWVTPFELADATINTNYRLRRFRLSGK